MTGRIDLTRARRVTVVPFLPSGDVVLVAEGGRMLVPEGPVEPGDDVLVDTVGRVPLLTAGFRRQGTHVLTASADGRHVVFWAEGARYDGARPHRRDAPWWTGPAAEAARRLRDQGDDRLARLVERADHARRTMTDEQYYADSQRLLDAAYLAAGTAEGGSGFGGDAGEWRAARSILCDAVDRDMTFLDAGCANGLLMETMAAWCGAAGHTLEPYGVDISPALVALARRRLPQWADRIWVGNALGWRPPGGRRFDLVHALLDCVPPHRHGDLVAHLLDVAVAPGGRLVVSHYDASDEDQSAEAILARLGYRVAGLTRRPGRRVGRPGPPSAWVEAP